MKKLRIGVIGLGGMGSNHCKSCTEIDEVALSAVCNISKDLLDEVASKYKVKGYIDYRELIKDNNIDAVIIATPHYLHPEIGMYAMKKGLHVLSEKPIAVTVDKADEFISVAKETKKVFSAMLQMRTYPNFRTAKKLIDEGKIGKIYRTLMVCGWFRAEAYYNSSGWRASWKTDGGGVLLNQSPHLLDMLCWLAGVPERIYAKVYTKRHKIEVEDEVHALLEYSNGATGYLYASVNEFPVESRIEILGDKGKLMLGEKSIKFISIKQSIQEFSDTAPDMWRHPESREEELSLQEGEIEHKAIIRNFARSVLYGEKLIAPGDEAINSLELANAILLSGKRNKEVKIPVDRKEIIKLYNVLIAISKPRDVAVKKRITDPKFAT